MLTPTHLINGQTFFLVACVSSGHAPTLTEGIFAATASLLPDLDSRQSNWLEDTFGHRTLSHSLLAQGVLGLLVYFTLPFGSFLAFISGWISHSIADIMTLSGVCWFWPNRARCVIHGKLAHLLN